MDDDSEHKVDDSDDGRVLDSEEIREEECDIVSENDGNTAMLTVEMSAFLSGFSGSTPTLVLLAPGLLWPGEAIHLELLGRKRVKAVLVYDVILTQAASPHIWSRRGVPQPCMLWRSAHGCGSTAHPLTHPP